MEFHKIGISSDHAGTAIRLKALQALRAFHLELTDFGPPLNQASVDYPDYVLPVAERINKKTLDGGIIFCGTGIGVCITANKIPGVRAAAVWSEETCRMARQHNAVNVLCLGARVLSEDLVFRLLDIWLTTPFEGGRHQKRLDKITDIERRKEI